jgi:hypothetical protein
MENLRVQNPYSKVLTQYNIQMQKGSDFVQNIVQNWLSFLGEHILS